MVKAHCMDMKDIPDRFKHVDLLWCEGAAYNIGFENALRSWRPAIRPSGFLVVSELCWLKDDIPPNVQEFFAEGYPDMKSVEENRTLVSACGYDVHSIHTLPDQCWVDGYYDILQPRALSLVEHSSESVREFAQSTLHEIDVFGRSESSYGYVFFVLRLC